MKQKINKVLTIVAVCFICVSLALSVVGFAGQLFGLLTLNGGITQALADSVWAYAGTFGGIGAVVSFLSSYFKEKKKKQSD